MKTFAVFQSEWELARSQDPELQEMMEQKLSSLLFHSEAEYLRQGLDFLLQCNGLVLLLCEKNGVIDVSEAYSGNRSLLERCLIEEVSQPESEWFGLFEAGCFDGMYRRAMEHTEWGELSDSLQKRLLEEVRQMVHIPDKSYSMGKYPVTQALWQHVMGSNPSQYRGSSRPVENVSWSDCAAFCDRYNQLNGLEKAYRQEGCYIYCNFESNGYRLPTEWEWWFAAAANQNFAFSGSDNPEEVAWYSGSRRYGTCGVGQKQPNGFGLYDMSGNVSEWCWDWYRVGPLSEGSTGPYVGPAYKRLQYRVRRGGDWGCNKKKLQLSNRGRMSPSFKRSTQGFRICRTIR